MSTVLVVSPYFPPSSLAGVHRARHLAKHLPAHGWNPVIVRVDERYYTESSDPDIHRLVAAEVQQVRVGALPAASLRPIGVGDIGLRGYWAIKAALAALAQKYSPRAVLITGSPFYPMMLSRWIKTRLCLPVVLDFQDPWVSREGALAARWSKPGLTHSLACALEPHALRHADFVTSVSDRQNDEMASRYPWLDRSAMAAIPIGGDPDDFEALRTAPLAQPVVRLDPDTINLSYVGTFLPRAGPLVRAVFRALRALRQAQPDLASRIRLHFIGTSNQPDGIEAFRVQAIAQEEAVGDLVHETPQRVPYLEALSLMSQSDGLLLIGSDEPHYTASKIYPALISGRPYLSLFHAASSAHGVLSQAGGGYALAMQSLADLDKLGPALTAALADLASARPIGRADPAAYAPYLASNVASAFASVLEQAGRRAHRP